MPRQRVQLLGQGCDSVCACSGRGETWHASLDHLTKRRANRRRTSSRRRRLRCRRLNALPRLPLQGPNGLGFRVLGLLLALVTLPASAQTVTDGDTIKLDGTRWRLWGIDAPETQQTCADGWPARIEVTAAMRRLIEGKLVTCEARGHDRYRRTIGYAEQPAGERRHGLGLHAV